MSQRVDDLYAHLVLESLHATHVAESNSRALNVSLCRRVFPIGDWIDDWNTDLLGQAKLLGKLKIGDGGIDIEGGFVLSRSLDCVTDAKQQSSVQQVGAGRWLVVLENFLDYDQCLGVLSLPVEGMRQARLDGRVVRLQTQGVPILVLSLIGPATAQKCVAQV
jgi:hypothetical protein